MLLQRTNSRDAPGPPDCGQAWNDAWLAVTCRPLILQHECLVLQPVELARKNEQAEKS